MLQAISVLVIIELIPSEAFDFPVFNPGPVNIFYGMLKITYILKIFHVITLCYYKLLSFVHSLLPFKNKLAVPVIPYKPTTGRFPPSFYSII